MEKLIRYFPLNKGIVKGDVKSLIKTIGIYIVSNMVLAVAVNILDFIPLVKNLLHHVDNVYELYIWLGSILGGIQYFTGVNTSQIEYVKIEDVLSLWYNANYRKYILIGAAVLCILPYGESKAVEKQPTDVADSAQTNEENEQNTTNKNKADQSTTDLNVVEQDKTEVTTEKETETETEAGFKREPAYERFIPGNFLGNAESPGLTFAVYDNGAEVIFYTEMTLKCTIPETIQYQGNIYEVKSIASEVFSYSSGLEELIIPDTVTTIGEGSIKGCNFLKKIYISENLTYLGNSSISSNTSLEDIYIPASLYEIGKYALCWNMEEAKISNAEHRDFLIEQNPDLTLQCRSSYKQEKPVIRQTEMTEMQKKFRDFTFTAKGMNIHYVYNTYFEVKRFETNRYIRGEEISTLEVVGIDNLLENPRFYFAEEGFYDKYLEQSKHKWDNVYYLHDMLEDETNVEFFVCKADGMTVLVDWFDNQYKASTKETGLPVLERKAKRGYEMSRAFTRVEESNADTDICMWLRERYAMLGEYKLKETTELYGFTRNTYKTMNGEKGAAEVQSLAIVNGDYSGTYIVGGLEEVYASKELYYQYGYSAYPGMQTRTYGENLAIIIFPNEYAMDLSSYPENWREVPDTDYEKLHQFSDVPAYFGIGEKWNIDTDMNNCRTTEAFGMLFEKSN